MGAFGRLNKEDLADPVGSRYVAAVALEGFEEAVDRMTSEIRGMAETEGAGSHMVLTEENHRSFWLAVSDLGATVDEEDGIAISAKLNYPISEWKRIIDTLEETCSRPGLSYAFQARSGNGICTLYLTVDAADPEAVDRAVESLEVLQGSCTESGGNLVILNAPLEMKTRLRMWGETGPHFAVMKRIKERIDPGRLMSPGRFVGGL